MLNRKGEFYLREWVIGILVFSAVIGIASIMAQSLAVDYGNTAIIDPAFVDNYDKFNENTEYVNDMVMATKSEEGLTLLNVADVLISSTFNVIDLVFSSFSTFASQLLSIPSDFGIPTQISSIMITLLIAVIGMSVVFLIINALNKTNRL